MKYIIALTFAHIVFSSCNSVLCGDLTGEWKQQFDNANVNAGNLRVENIPCEFFYINVIVPIGKVDTFSIHSIHKYLYNQEKKSGWQVLLVYDIKENYLFSHKYNDSIYIQNGD